MDQKQLDDVEHKEEFSSEDSDVRDEDPLDMPENENREDISEEMEVEPLNESEIPEAAADSDERGEESNTTTTDSYTNSESETETFSHEEPASSEEKTNDVNDIIENNHNDEESKPGSNPEPESNQKPQDGDSWKTDDNEVPKSSNWKYISGVLLILLVVAIYSNGFNFTGSVTAVSALTQIDAEDKVLDYVNSNLLQPPFTAVVISSEELDNLFQVTLEVAGQEVSSYVTKDGRFFFPQGFDLDALSELEAQETKLVEVSVDDDSVKGDPDAPVTMIEFSEFQCPFCKRYIDDAYLEIIKEYVDTGKVKYVFRDFPLSFHNQAKPAAMAAECAHEQGKFWEYHDLLFENNDQLGIENYKKWAVDLDLDTEQFNNCLDTEKYLEEVEKDFSDGQKYGVSGTPAFFINGKLISGAQPFAAFKEAIEKALGSLEETEELAELEEQIEAEEMEEITETQESEPAVKEIQMAVKKWRFDPKHIEVNEGDQIKLTISSEELDINFILSAFRISEKITAGEPVTVEFTADKTGTFNFFCGDYCIGKYGQIQGVALGGEIVVN
jgi:protein-disulfide isomerase